jgi:hypothetical protein
MRKAVNDNPVVQAALVGLLLIAAAFLFMTRIAGSGSEPDQTATSTDVTGLETSSGTSAQSVTPIEPAPAPGGASSEGAPPASGVDFKVGPGLPKPVVSAYDSGKTVVLLITKPEGIDDREMEARVNRLSGRRGVATFTTTSKHVADYSRIASGVNVDRVPAIVVLQPKSQAKGGAAPKAAVAYGYRGYRSVLQMVRDARYDGPKLPYYPE